MNEAGTELLTAKAVARLLAVPRWDVYQLSRDGRLPGLVRIGRRRLRWDPLVLAKFIEGGGGSLGTSPQSREPAAQVG
jgi:predicted DNA-binding transcriptional regulator AlpA